MGRDDVFVHFAIVYENLHLVRFCRHKVYRYARGTASFVWQLLLLVWNKGTIEKQISFRSLAECVVQYTHARHLTAIFVRRHIRTHREAKERAGARNVLDSRPAARVRVRQGAVVSLFLYVRLFRGNAG